MAQRRYRMERTSIDCESILRRTRTGYDYPIGGICRTDRGWTYSYVGPSPGTKHGPVSSRHGAILRAVKNYRAWIGGDL